MVFMVSILILIALMLMMPVLVFDLFIHATSPLYVTRNLQLLSLISSSTFLLF